MKIKATAHTHTHTHTHKTKKNANRMTELWQINLNVNEYKIQNALILSAPLNLHLFSKFA